jgi:hypothetical protein
MVEVKVNQILWGEKQRVVLRMMTGKTSCDNEKWRRDSIMIVIVGISKIMSH